MRDKRNFIVYVSGPYRALSAWNVRENIRRAERVALDVWREGYTAICPHLNTANYQGALPDDVWLAGDIAILRRCDAIMLVSGWETSSGTHAELRFADQHGIPVFTHLTELNEYFHQEHPYHSCPSRGIGSK